MLKIYFLATFYLGYFQNPKKMLPFQLATFWYVVYKRRNERYVFLIKKEYSVDQHLLNISAGVQDSLTVIPGATEKKLKTDLKKLLWRVCLNYWEIRDTNHKLYFNSNKAFLDSTVKLLTYYLEQPGTVLHRNQGSTDLN